MKHTNLFPHIQVFMSRWIVFAVMSVSLCLLAHAQEKRSWPSKALHAIRNYMDSSMEKGIDTCYINVPERPWQVISRFNMNGLKLKMKSVFEEDGVRLGWEPSMSTQTAYSIGLWVGYRGYGLGYSVNVGHQSGTFFTIGAMGSSYGINLRLRTFGSAEPDVRLTLASDEDGSILDAKDKASLHAPIRVRSLMLDGYYIFNSSRFSYAAAYDQSALQVRSAGSLLVGAQWNALTVRYNDDQNAAFIDLMHKMGTIKIRQGSIGAGYAYNWVPMRGLLVNVMAMPMLTLYNRSKAEFYDIYMDMESISTEHDYIVYRESRTRWSNITPTFNARASLTYNWNIFFLNVYGQWTNHNYHHDSENSGRINDWYVNTSLGVRF